MKPTRLAASPSLGLGRSCRPRLSFATCSTRPSTASTCGVGRRSAPPPSPRSPPSFPTRNSPSTVSTIRATCWTGRAAPAVRSTSLSPSISPSSPAPDLILAVRLAADYGVRVHTVGFGSTDGDVVDFGGRSMRAMLDLTTLRSMAELTRGEYFAADSPEALVQVYETLSTRLVPERKLTEIAFILAGIAALVSIAAASLSVLWFGRIT
jgi:hypothetical protein